MPPRIGAAPFAEDAAHTLQRKFAFLVLGHWVADFARVTVRRLRMTQLRYWRSRAVQLTNRILATRENGGEALTRLRMRNRGDSKQAFAPERLYYRPREIAALTGLGLRTVYANVYAGIIPSRKIGDARLIPASWLFAQTEAEAEEIRRTFADPPRRNSPKNRYSLGKSPRMLLGLLRLVQMLFSQQLRGAAAT